LIHTHTKILLYFGKLITLLEKVLYCSSKKCNTLEYGKIFSIKYILLESFRMNSSTDINSSSGTVTLTFRTHKQAPAGGGICRGLYQVSYDKTGKGRKRISSSVLQGYSQCPISRCAAALLNHSYVSEAMF
jgi:hypothetical protein